MASASKVREWYVVGMSGKVLVSRRGRYRRLLKMPLSLNANFPFIVRLIPSSSKAALHVNTLQATVIYRSQGATFGDDRDPISS